MLETREDIFEALRSKEIPIRTAVLMLTQLSLLRKIKKEVCDDATR